MTDLPILYSFRRCPYAIRARLALAAAGLRPGSDLALREVSLKARPPELLAASPKATVPVPSPCVMPWKLAATLVSTTSLSMHFHQRIGTDLKKKLMP